MSHGFINIHRITISQQQDFVDIGNITEDIIL